MMEEEYNGIDNEDVIMMTYLNMANLIIGALTRKGLDCTTTNTFTHLLSDSLIIKLSEYTMKQFVKSGFAPTNPHEFKEFLGI